MLIRERPPLHLAYGSNVFSGESWTDHFAALRDHLPALRGRLGRAQPMGVGLRLGAQAAEELAAPSRLRAFRDFLRTAGLYVFTVNAFPYGRFHGARVKEQVYAPDWRTAERLDYTLRCADLLAALLPEGVGGSISTVPGSFKPWIESEADVQRMETNLLACADALAALRARTGRSICLALEPEPGCFVETTEETERFFCGRLQSGAAGREHLGVCLDTCHAAVQFEDPSESLARLRNAGIRIAKVQLSAALETDDSPAALDSLAACDEPVYLHQAVLRRGDGSRQAWLNLPEAIESIAAERPPARGPGAPCAAPDLKAALRTHFHVPLYWSGTPALRSTARVLTPAFWRRVQSGVTEHLEIETYTWAVLPADVRAASLDEHLTAEYRCAIEQLRLHSPDSR